jgi:hypothetical protein
MHQNKMPRTGYDTDKWRLLGGFYRMSKALQNPTFINSQVIDIAERPCGT